MSVDVDRFPVLQLRRGKNKSLSLQLLCNPYDMMGKTPTAEAPGDEEDRTQYGSKNLEDFDEETS